MQEKTITTDNQLITSKKPCITHDITVSQPNASHNILIVLR